MSLSLNPRKEAFYRLELAKGYLERARTALALKDFASTIGEAQLSVENSAKAVISCFQIPSWYHDPSEELLEVTENNRTRIVQLLGEDFMKRLKDLAEKAHAIAPEHGRSTYGDVERRIPPWQIYSGEDAQRGLNLAEDAYRIAEGFVKTWYAC